MVAQVKVCILHCNPLTQKVAHPYLGGHLGCLTLTLLFLHEQSMLSKINSTTFTVMTDSQYIDSNNGLQASEMLWSFA